jgi:hypothetical protein
VFLEQVGTVWSRHPACVWPDHHDLSKNLSDELGEVVDIAVTERSVLSASRVTMVTLGLPRANPSATEIELEI